jgi:hypothetical protein
MAVVKALPARAHRQWIFLAERSSKTLKPRPDMAPEQTIMLTAIQETNTASSTGFPTRLFIASLCSDLNGRSRQQCARRGHHDKKSSKAEPRSCMNQHTTEHNQGQACRRSADGCQQPTLRGYRVYNDTYLWIQEQTMTGLRLASKSELFFSTIQSSCFGESTTS